MGTTTASIDMKQKLNMMHRLGLHLICDSPDVKDLTEEQKCALHEFFHTVLAAGFKLYQVVPESKAEPILRKKFHIVIGHPAEGETPSGSNGGN